MKPFTLFLRQNQINKKIKKKKRYIAVARPRKTRWTRVVSVESRLTETGTYIYGKALPEK